LKKLCFAFSYEVPVTDQETSETILMPVYLREKKSSACYSPTNLFGQPLLVGVPRNGTTYEKLYEVIFKQLSRYVTPPGPNNEWWRPFHIVTNGEKVTVNGAGPSTSSAGMFKYGWLLTSGMSSEIFLV
jgi:hypothetical protein